MSLPVLGVMNRPDRRTHLVAGAQAPLCGTRTSISDATVEWVSLVNPTGSLFMAELVRLLDDNTCLHCTRLAGIFALLAYSARRKS